MTCFKNTELFNSNRPEYMNTNVFHAMSDETTVVSASGLVAGQTVTVQVSDTQSGTFTNYMIGGTVATLTVYSPQLIVDDGKWYKLVPSANITTSSNVSVSTKTTSSVTATSEKAWFYTDSFGRNHKPVEIIRYEGVDEPVIYDLGEGTEFRNSAGTGKFGFDRVQNLAFSGSVTSGEVSPEVFTYNITHSGTITYQNIGTNEIFVRARTGTSGAWGQPLKLEPNQIITFPTDSTGSLQFTPVTEGETVSVTIWNHSFYWRIA